MAKFRWLFCGLLFLSVQGLFAANIDSLKNVAADQPDSLKVDTWLDISYYFGQDSMGDSAMRYAELGMMMADSLRDSAYIRDAYYRMGRAYRLEGDSVMADSMYDMGREWQHMYGFTLKNFRNSFNNAYEYDYIRNSLGVWPDSLGTLTFDSVLKAGMHGGFRSNHYTGKPIDSMVYWVRFRLNGHRDSAENVLFMVGRDNSSWDTVDAWIPDDQGRYIKYRSGLNVAAREKTAVKDWRNLFVVPMDTNESKIVYLRLSHISTGRDPDAIEIMLLLSHYLSDIESIANRNLAIFLGILVAQWLYFLLLFLSTGARTYIPYLIYIAGVTLFAWTAYAYHDVFPLQSDYDYFFYFVSIGIAGVGLLGFALSYLNIKSILPKWFKIGRITQVIFAIPPLFMATLFTAGFMFDGGPSESPEWLNQLAGFMVSTIFLSVSFGLIFTVVLGVLALKKGYKPASAYLVGMIFLILLVGLTPIIGLFFPQSFIEGLTYQHIILAAQSGIVLQLIFFALGVGQKIKQLEKDNAQALADKLGAEQEANEKLRQADKLKDEFLANTSHELRTPLNGILGLTEAVHDGVTGPTTVEMQENLQMVMSSAKRLSGLVSDLLDFSKLKNYELELQLRPLDLKPLCQVVRKVSETMLMGKDLELVADIPEDLPPVQADENRLQQILYNLIGNAIKFTEQGSVTLQARLVDNHIRIAVIDTGIGIPEEQQERIFQSFEQADGSTAREYGGTGLGLSITRQLVELHGGNIGVSSSPGEGSTFYFTLPLSTEKVEKKALAPGDGYLLTRHEGQMDGNTQAAETALPAKVGSGYYHILVVDDEPVNRQVLRNHLATEEFYVTTVMNGVEALEAIESGQHFDLVLLDVMMPKLSGFEVCQRIRERYMPSELPVIMITAKNQVSDLVTGLTNGANDYIVKPFSKQELLARIQTHLRLLRISKATSRFVPYEFLRSLGRDTITDVQLGDQVERTGTVLFSDIRGYTRLAEEMNPEQTFAFLNAYLGRMGPVIQQHNGFVNQFYGDGIMALFLGQSEDAVQASKAMLRTLKAYNAERADKQREALRIGVGLHTGSLMMGMIGDEQRLDTGLVSDTVNTAARLEGITKQYQADILFSEAVYQGLADGHSHNIRLLGRVQVVGRQGTLNIYECFCENESSLFDLKLQTSTTLHQGFDAYFARDFKAAQEALESILAVFPDDPVSQRQLELSQYWLNNPLPENWNGAETMQKK